MNNELVAVLNYMEKERGINREVLITALESALLAASRKSVTTAQDIRIEIDRKTFDIRVLATMTVSERAKAAENQISVAKARKINKDAQVGDKIDIEVTPDNFGRIAAQTAKQTILQKIRQAEKDIVYEEFKDRVGDIITGTVRRFNRGDILIDLGRTEGVLPSKERVPTEEYQIGDRVRSYIVTVENASGGTVVTLSRSHPDFVRRLFELEVAEIADGTVEIKGIAREPGYRTKVAVVSHDEKVDSVGACVGMRGLRVKNIVRELSGEKIDIVRWSDDIKQYVTNALSPARLLKVSIDPDQPKLVHVITDADQLPLAIGKRAQNVRLTSKLLGWRINIGKEEAEATFDEKVAKAVSLLASVEGITPDHAKKLVKAGFLTMEGIASAELADLEAVEGFDAAVAKTVYEAAVACQKHEEPDEEPQAESQTTTETAPQAAE